MSTLEERVQALEDRYATLRVPPVRQELTDLRDVHGLRLDAIEVRLRVIEHELSETTSWIERRFSDIDATLAEILRRLPT